MSTQDYNYYDIHGHINFPDYDDDREQVIKRAEEKRVFMLTIGTDIDSSHKAIKLSKQFSNIGACIGYHPANKDEIFDLSILDKMAKDPSVLAIGEVGLDYFHQGEETRKSQIERFVKQIYIANDTNKPLMLHVRNSKTMNAYREALEIIKSEARVPFNFHFFAGNIEDLKNILDSHGTVSFTGVITFTHDYDNLISYVPLDRVMSETDCPYVSPVPYRGKRNEPTYVIEVVRAIARIRNMEEEKMRQILAENARHFLGWS